MNVIPSEEEDKERGCGGKYLKNGGAYIFRNNIISSYVFRDSMGLFDYKAFDSRNDREGRNCDKKKKNRNNELL